MSKMSSRSLHHKTKSERFTEELGSMIQCLQ